ncbi:putative integral membrane protein [Frigoribacterium sp. JB110]|nr:putative integral membrane protein [Frigoribacterium sp. JB110]
MGSVNGVWDALGKAIARVLRLRLVRAALMFSDHRGGLLAAAITFRTLFAVFAAVLLGFSAASIWLSTRSDLWDALVAMVDQLVPGLVGTGDDAMIDVSTAPTLPAGNIVAGVVSVIALIWALVSAVGNLRMSVRSIAGTRHANDAAWLMRVYDLLFAVSIGVLLVASAAVTFLGTAFTDQVLDWLGVSGSGAGAFLTKAGTILVVFALDAVIIGWMFWLQSGMKVRVRQLVLGSLFGAAGLVVLQQLSSLFVGGADSNPLLASFASLIALLLWFNLSAQVILIASAYIVLTVEDGENRIGATFGAETLKQRAVRAAERDVRVATDALTVAREEELAEREQQTQRRNRARP